MSPTAARSCSRSTQADGAPGVTAGFPPDALFVPGLDVFLKRRYRAHAGAAPKHGLCFVYVKFWPYILLAAAVVTVFAH